jgi:hypothetical protein
MTAQMQTTMSAVEQKVLADAIKKITALGFQFAIIDRDGRKHGDLEVATEPAVPRNDFRQFGYIERVRAMQVGDVEVFEIHDASARENYRSAVVGCGIKAFGTGTMTSCFNAAGNLEVMRVA